METDSKLKIQWYDVTPPAHLHGPFGVTTKAHFGSAHTHPGVIIVKCSYAANDSPYGINGWGCLRVENVPLMQLEELAQNFLVLAEARYGNT